MAWRPVDSLDKLRAARPWLARRLGGVNLALAVVDGTPYAVEDRCSHAGCPFSEEAELVDGVIVCNCHGSEFDMRTGEVQRGPAEYPVRTFPVRVSGDDLEVDV